MRVSLSLTDPRWRLQLCRVSYFEIATERALEWVVTLLSGAVGVEFLRRWWAGHRQRREQASELSVRILDEGAALRHEAYERERMSAELLRGETERRHRAEVEAVRALHEAEIARKDATIASLTRRLTRMSAVLDAHNLPNPDHVVVRSEDSI